MARLLEAERPRTQANPQDRLPEGFVHAMRHIKKDPTGLLRHDKNSFLVDKITGPLKLARSPLGELLSLRKHSFAEYVRLTDTEITDVVPAAFDLSNAPDVIKNDPLMKLAEKAEGFRDQIPGTLMNLRDSMGFFIALNNDVNGVEPDPELESASVYLDRLKARRMPLAPLCELYNSTLLNRDRDITVNGVEFIILMNLLKNADAHNGGEMPTGTSSTVEYGQLTRDFTVKNIAGSDLPRSNMSVAELAEDDHYGKFITGVMAAMLDKGIEYPSDPTLFIARVKGSPLMGLMPDGSIRHVITDLRGGLIF